MKKLTFKQWYAIIVLVVLILYGGLYLIENRYRSVGDAGAMFDTWTWTYKPASDFLDLGE